MSVAIESHFGQQQHAEFRMYINALLQIVLGDGIMANNEKIEEKLLKTKSKKGLTAMVVMQNRE